jgi:alpha-tubulin suppressor-like RCC1 family protein
VERIDWVRAVRLCLSLSAALLFVECSDSSGPDPIDPNSIEGQITALYPEGPTLRDAAMTRIAAVRAALAQTNAATAKSQALSLVDLTLTSLAAGTLTGGKVQSTRAAASRLIDAVYQLVSLTPPAIPDAALTDDGAAKIIGPSGGTVATPSGGAGVQFPPGTLPSEVLVTIVRIPATTPGTGPLPTSLKQYPPYYDFATTPAVVFSDSARVGICQVTDPSSPFYAPEPHDRLRLAHTVGPAGQTTVEILNRVSVDDLVRCTSVTANATNFDAQFGWRGALASIVDGALGMVRPTELFAAHGGLGGKTKSFSPFAAVDPTSGPVANVTVTINPSAIRVNENALATAVLKDAAGNVLAGRSITWSTNASPFASIGASTGIITGVAPGIATITATSEGKTGTATVTVSAALFVASSVVTGGSHTCALTNSGAAYCWGSNIRGELGDGTLTNRPTPVRVTGNLSFVTLAAGSSYTCGVTNVGTTYCWGRNDNGLLGDGTVTDRLAPTLVAGGLSFVSLYAGLSHACGLTGSGAGYCWGFGLNGEIGDGTRNNRSVPTLIAGNLTFRSLAVGSPNTCGLTTSGQAYCWGYNTNGQIGDGTVGNPQSGSNPLTPSAVIGGLTFQSLVVGAFHDCGLTAAGVGYCWGGNGNGQVGDGTTTDRVGPTAMVGGLTFSRLAGGLLRYTCGIATSGAAYCWGENNVGQLGDGTSGNSRLNPTAVSGSFTFTSLAIGSGHSCGLTGNGTLYCWGDNGLGQLGDGTVTRRTTPTPVIVQ